MSGTSETSLEANVQLAGCRCGRVHPSAPPKRKPPRRAEDRLGPKIYAAVMASKAAQDPGSGIWYVAYQGDCLYPGIVNAHDSRYQVKRLVRCRKCDPCRNARRYYWGRAAIEQTRQTTEAGLRTWFGTLTLNQEARQIMLARARLASREPNAQYWDDLKCDFRFDGIRRQLVSECRRMWARLRKKHRFTYLLVFERHKSGDPHMHVLVHERSGRILKRELQSQWPWGFTNFHIVGGASSEAVAPEKAAWYVVKYLSKDNQARQISSQGYRPRLRASRHSEETNVKTSSVRQDRNGGHVEKGMEEIPTPVG